MYHHGKLTVAAIKIRMRNQTFNIHITWTQVKVKGANLKKLLKIQIS